MVNKSGPERGRSSIVLDVVASMKNTILINKESLPMQKWFTEVHNTDADSVIDLVPRESR